MRRIIIFALFLINLSVFRISADNFGQISFKVMVIGENIPDEAEKLLTSRLEQAVAQNGFGTINHDDHFVMVAKCHILQKDITPTTPARISQTIELNLIVGDASENKIYSSCSIETKGIGVNETKAWQTAIRNISPGQQK